MVTRQNFGSASADARVRQNDRLERGEGRSGGDERRSEQSNDSGESIGAEANNNDSIQLKQLKEEEINRKNNQQNTRQSEGTILLSLFRFCTKYLRRLVIRSAEQPKMLYSDA
jgi:hypothetical protein